jgi:hypothetical protein
MGECIITPLSVKDERERKMSKLCQNGRQFWRRGGSEREMEISGDDWSDIIGGDEIESFN